jgi:short-subunit dehydrogenase
MKSCYFPLATAWKSTGQRIVAIDKQHCPIVEDIGNARFINLDLNPLTHPNSYKLLASELKGRIQRTLEELRSPGVGTLILSAGCYDWGCLADTTIEVRKRLIGVNVCGKIELIHAVLAVNQALGFKNSDELTLVDVGSLHGLVAAGNRSLYGATKAMGLDLCASLQRGGEIKRAIHVAPGAIDTHMLHRNHWVSKEGGPIEFLEALKDQGGTLYEDVFVMCNETGFARAASRYLNPLNDVFHRYKRRRKKQFKHKHGVLNPIDVAHRVVKLLKKKSSSGVHILTAPKGIVRMQNLKFTEIRQVQMLI